ncbi:MAG: glycosyltransferase family 25 protein [Rhodobacteraceae bacterium]|nr:glycosyltransferase family 25 protein [Paracoccaceae bacterium]
MLRTIIINMATATDRMGFMAAQMAHFNLSWERLEAVTPATLTPPADDPVWRRWQRPLRQTEMALCASHMRVWEQVLKHDAPCLILEDDAVLAADLPDFLARVTGLPNIDHLSLETRGRRKFVSIHMHPAAPVRRLWQDRTGAAAYIAWPRGARQMLARAHAAGGGPADAVISGTWGMKSFQADPALSVQLDMCDRYGIPQAIPVRSLVDVEDKPTDWSGYSAAARRGFRRRRVWAQISMGVRQAVRMPKGRRMHIRPAFDWPGLSVTADTGAPGSKRD